MKAPKIPFLTFEVGSFRKPGPLLKAAANKKLEAGDFEELERFLSLIQMSGTLPELKALLKQAGPDQKYDDRFHDEVNRWLVRLNIKYKESTGIDLVDAGEWLRREMYQHVIDNDTLTGIQLLTHVRSFDYNFWKPGVYTGPVTYDSDKPIYLQEFEWAKEFATKPLKICLTAFNTVAEWTIQGRGYFEDIVFDLIDEVYIPEVVKLLDAGANWIQLDEPALTTDPSHVDTFVDAWNYFVTRIKGHLRSDTVLGLHNCFSDYSLLWPALPELSQLGAMTLEFANRDSWNAGTGDIERPAYHHYAADVKNLYETGFTARIALGVIPVHTTHETPPELVRDRLLYTNRLVGDPELVLAAPDCGLRQQDLVTAHKLLKNLVEGAKMARKTIEP
ncbi:MAG: hypothetical protein ACFFD4_19975 [Candidatus Odinarchaeota archaeon]